MGLDAFGKYVLFSGAFDNPVKNASLAKDTVDLIPEAQLIELKGYSRSQVSVLMHAVDALLMTSFTEGSPQVIKEAMACVCPIVSVDVGDVKERVSEIDGCFISDPDPRELAGYLSRAISFEKRTAGRDAIIQSGLTNDVVAQKIVDIYRTI
jgi:glycosyltransferase involved in cell wall biosynthesis